ncbi:MAG TPA: hypothetical protein VF283_18200 [Bryobacteraceae bacterium]
MRTTVMEIFFRCPHQHRLQQINESPMLALQTQYGNHLKAGPREIA